MRLGRQLIQTNRRMIRCWRKMTITELMNTSCIRWHEFLAGRITITMKRNSITSTRITSKLRWHLCRAPPLSSDSLLDHRSLPPVFESWRGHIWRLFHLWPHFITFGGHSAHLAYHVHKSGRKTSIIIIWHSCMQSFLLSRWLESRVEI